MKNTSIALKYKYDSRIKDLKIKHSYLFYIVVLIVNSILIGYLNHWFIVYILQLFKFKLLYAICLNKLEFFIYQRSNNCRQQFNLSNNHFIHFCTCHLLLLSHTPQMDVNQIFFIGHNKYGQAGIGQEQHNRKFTKPKEIVFKTFIKEISCGNHHSALLTIDGLIYTMGSNIHGTLGLGSSNGINYAFKPTLVSSLKQVDKICSGSHHMCAIKQGELYSWGKGIDGQLGHSNMKNLFTPTKVQALGSSVQKVCCGLNHTLVLLNNINQSKQINGYAFGNGIYGQLGCGSNKSFNYPVNIKLSKISEFSAGENHSLFLSNGQLYGCGDNSQLQIGISQNTKNKKYILEPQRLKILQNQVIVQVDCFDVSAVLTASHKVYIWGGKTKIWPPTQIEQQQASTIKLSTQKLYILNQKNEIISFKIPSHQDGIIQKQILISGKNILDFDCGENHILAIGDIVAQVPQKQELQTLSIWNDSALQTSKQKFSLRNIHSEGKHQLSDSMQKQSIKGQNINFRRDQGEAMGIKIQELEKMLKTDCFLTKHLRSGQTSLGQQISEFEELPVQSKHLNMFYLRQQCAIQDHQNKVLFNRGQNAQSLENSCHTLQNLSSSIQIEYRQTFPVNNSQVKRLFQERNGFQNKNRTLPCQQLSVIEKPSTTFPPILDGLASDIQIKSYGEAKLQRLMTEMQKKTIHLKRNSQPQVKSGTVSSHQYQFQLNQQKQNCFMKTPSSYIKKEPEKFILQSSKIYECTSFNVDPQIQAFHQKYDVNLELRQKKIDLNRLNCNQTETNQKKIKKIKTDLKHIDEPKQAIKIFMQAPQCHHRVQPEAQKNKYKNHQIITQREQINSIQEYICEKKINNQGIGQNSSIEKIFKHLLKKQNRRRQQCKQVKIRANFQLQNELEDQQGLTDRSKRLSHSCISQKTTFTVASKLIKKQSRHQQSSQNISKSNLNIFNHHNQSNLPFKYSPSHNQGRLACSKLSSHSNTSVLSKKTSSQNIDVSRKRNADLLQISRSNRQLRYQLRERDFKISQLQQNLSKKELDYQILFGQYQNLQNCLRKCQQCSYKLG